MSHASMLKARRKHQKIAKLIEGVAKKAKRLEREALKGATAKPEKVKKERVKKEKVVAEKVVKKVKLSKEELGRQDATAKKTSPAGGKKGAK